MAFALVDNASLTGVQRLLGEIPLRSKDVVEADIGSLEALVTAILLYDDVIAIDDYKDRFRQQRHARFPFIRFLEPDLYGLPGVRRAAVEQIDDLNPTIRGGEFEDPDMRTLLESLRMHMICTWDLASSVYYLTLKLLGSPGPRELDKYSKLSAAIFGELQDLSGASGHYDPSVQLLDSRGRPIEDDYRVIDRHGRSVETRGMSKPLEAFIAALRWLSLRTVYYALAAEHFRADVLLYPIRQHYHLHYLKKTRRVSSDFVTSTIAAMNANSASALDSVVNANRASRLALNLPLFTSWLVLETQDVRRVLPLALEIRDEKYIRDARDQLRVLRLLVEEGDAASASRRAQSLLRDLDAVLASLRQRFGVKTPQGPTVGTAVQMLNPLIEAKAGVTLPEFGQGTNLIPNWLTERWPRRGTGALYREVTRDLAHFPRLGAIRDLLGAAVDIETQSAGSFPVKVEAPEFRNYKSGFKIPM